MKSVLRLAGGTGKNSIFRLWLMIGALFICQTLNSCSSSTPRSLPPDSPEDFATALGQAGAEVRFGQEGEQTVLGLVPQALQINGEQVWVYHSSERTEASRIQSAFEPGQFIWASGHLIVQYSGKDGGTILLMESLLGEPLIQPSVAGDEPYPPAVPAAIRQVAKDLNQQPTEIEVLAYETVEWHDACLDMGQADEICPEEVTTGWRIDLRFEGMVIEARTDLLGDVVRWQTP